MTRLADDRRARVPFALVGVLLLVGSVTVATTLSTRAPSRLDRSVETSIDRTTAETTTALRSAAADAAARAARQPVISRAETPAGAVLNASTPFRDALRIRIYLQARDHLRQARHRRDEVRAAASLPAAPNASALRAAKRRVHVHAVENGTAMQVRIRGVEVAVRRAGQVVTRDVRTFELTVATPVLALHDRATSFQRRLDRGPLGGPGLGRRLTARLYPVVWARGYAQHAGAPIQNVLANRHVELTTNGAVLAMQREQFGRSDPDARDRVARAMARTGVKDLLGPYEPPAIAGGRRVSALPNHRVSTEAKLPSIDTGAATVPQDTLSFHAGQAADSAIVNLTENDALTRALRRGYRVKIRLRTARTAVHVESRPDPISPGDEWQLVEETTRSDPSVVDAAGPRPTATSDERSFAAFTRLVELERTVRWTWERENETATTSADWNETYRVGVALVGEYTPGERAPSRPVEPLFEPGGALGGPNLADVPGRAWRRAVERRGGPDAVAAMAARGALETDQGTVVGDRPASLRNWTRSDLSSLRRRIRNVSVAVSAGKLATGEASPPALLAARLRERRSALVDPPATYDGAADRARVRARALYVDAVTSELTDQAKEQRTVVDSLDESLRNEGLGSLGRVRRILDSRRRVTRSDRRALAGEPPGGPVVVTPDAAPSYLSLAAVDHRRLRTVDPGRRYYPLAARNTNLFTAPYGDASDAVLESVTPAPDQTRLRTAAQVLVAANRTAVIANDARLNARIRALRTVVERATRDVVMRARRALARRTQLSVAERRRVVAAATAQWDGPGRRALAAANGSLAAAVTAGASTALDGPRETRLRVHLRVTLRNAVARARVRQRLVNRTRVRVEAVANEFLSRAGSRGVSTATRKSVAATVGGLPAGLPVVPPPGQWYVTVNVWDVQVRGVYSRFTLRTRRGPPGPPITYVRDGSVVRLDVDGDGTDERLGRADRIAFDTRTAVVVAVPPNGRGVGDVGGDSDERSAGWPEAGVRTDSAGTPVAEHCESATRRKRSARPTPVPDSAPRTVPPQHVSLLQSRSVHAGREWQSF